MKDFDFGAGFGTGVSQENVSCAPERADEEYYDPAEIDSHIDVCSQSHK